MDLAGLWFRLLALGLAAPALTAAAADRELIRDAHFQGGFHLLDPKPGQRAVYGQLPGLSPGRPVWDLAQWSSNYPLQTNDGFSSPDTFTCSNGAKVVVVGRPGTAAADLSLALNAGIEYSRARKSADEPWVHLLVQQDFTNPPSLRSLRSLAFHVEARLKHSKLVSTNDYLPSLHAAQFLVYLTVGNRNPASPGYQECFWFGVPIYDNRARIVSAYENRDFGGTGLFIFSPASDTFAGRSTHDRDWVAFDKDLLPLIRQGLDKARAKGFLKTSADLADFRPLGIFIGWEVPGRFEVDLQLRNLRLVAADR